MRILLDTCVPQRLRLSLPEHEVRSARYAGLDGLLDGQLLSAIEGNFDVLVTCDRSIPWQQNMQGRKIAVVILEAVSNRLPDLLPLLPLLRIALDNVKPGHVEVISLP